MSLHQPMALSSIGEIMTGSERIRYTIAAGEGCCCGPAFGPSLSEEIFEIPGTSAPGSVLLKMQEPFAYNNEMISYVVVTPRYGGDTLLMLRDIGCIVNVFRVLPEKLDQLRDGSFKDSTEYLAVGECRPLAE